MQRVLVRALSLGSPRKAYEEGFKSVMLASVRPGDCVWDVGANVGLYSELFVAAVGSSGKVISFEPSPACVTILKELTCNHPLGASWEIAPVALSDKDGQAWLSLADGDTAPSNRLASSEELSGVLVQTTRADSLHATGYEAPAVVKIDVEGFEGEVLDGMSSVLKLPSLRTVCIEVHFGLLNERRKPSEPMRIVRLLEAHSFSVKWVDKSHLVAQR